MKTLRNLFIATLASCWLAAGLSAVAGTGDAAESGKTAQKAKPYLLKTCLVSGEKLGEMGKPYIFVHNGQEIKLCCNNCLKDFKKEPDKFLKKLAAAQKKLAESEKKSAK